MARLNRVDESTITFKVKGNSAKGTEAANNRELKDRHTMAELVSALKQRSPFLETLHLEQIWFDYAYNKAVSKLLSKVLEILLIINSNYSLE